MFTKEQIVSTYRAKMPELSKYDDDAIYRSVLKKFPEYKTELQKPTEPEATGFVDSLPNWWKKGYNDSITGMADELMTGKKRFDLSGYEPGVVEDIASFAASMFASPADLGLTIASGGVGAKVGQSVARKLITKKLLRNGVASSKANVIGRRAARKAYGVGVGRASGGLAGYEGVKSAFTQKLETGDIKPEEVIKDTISGAVLGGATVGTGAYLTSKGWSTLSKVTAEAGVLGTATPLTEGDIPTPQDYINSAGMIVGLKAVGGAIQTPGKLKQFWEKSRRPENRREMTTNEIAETVGEVDGSKAFKSLIQKEEWLDGNGEKWTRISPPDSKKVRMVSFSKGENKTLSEKEFQVQYKLSDEVEIPIEKVQKYRAGKVRELEKSLNVDDTQKQLFRYESLGKKSRDAVDTIKTDDTKIPLDYLKPKELFRYRDSLLKKKTVADTIDKIKAEGWVTQEAKSSILPENFFPAPIASLMKNLTRTKYRGSQKQAIRQHFYLVGKHQTYKDTLTGEYLGNFLKTGLFTPSKKEISKFKTKGMSFKEAEEAYYVNLYDLVEGGRLPEINTATTVIAQRFVSAGGDFPGFTKNYVPKMVKRDVADVIFNDMLGVFSKKSEIAKRLKQEFDTSSIDFLTGLNANPNNWLKKNDKLATYLDSIIKRNLPSLRRETKQMLSVNLERGAELPYLKAYSKVANGLQEELFNVFGNLEKSRKFNIPDEILERNLKTVLTRYATKAANRTSFVQNFGAKGKKFEALLKNADDNDKGIMREIHHHVKGDIEYHSNYNYQPNTKEFFQKVMEWETSSKIGLGYAPLMNVTQSTISTALEAGYIPFFRGIFSLTDKKTRELIERSGVTNYSMFNEMIGVSKSQGLSSKVTDFLGKWSGFTGINKVNQVLAASTAKGMVDDLYKAVKGKGIYGKSANYRKWAESKLRQFDIDPKKSRLLDEDYLKAMSKFARKTQLQKDLLEDPLWFNNPKVRVFTQFKRFGYRQFNYLKDLFAHDISHGNIMPVLRLGIAGVAGGTIANKAKDWARGTISGEKVVNPDSKMPEDLEDIVDNIASIGAFGFMGDVVSATMEEGRTYSNALKFLAYPPFISDMENMITKFLPAVEKDFTNYRQDALLRMPSRMMRLTGSSFLREGAKRFETTGMTLDRIKSTRSRRLSKILTMLERASEPADYDKVVGEIRDWNQSFPQSPILSSDVSAKKIYKRKLRKYKKQVLG